MNIFRRPATPSPAELRRCARDHERYAAELDRDGYHRDAADHRGTAREEYREARRLAGRTVK